MERRFKKGEVIQVIDSNSAFDVHGWAAGEYGRIKGYTDFIDMYAVYFDKFGTHNILEKYIIACPHLKLKHPL